jgi:hypothetical protein
VNGGGPSDQPGPANSGVGSGPPPFRDRAEVAPRVRPRLPRPRRARGPDRGGGRAPQGDGLRARRRTTGAGRAVRCARPADRLRADRPLAGSQRQHQRYHRRPDGLDAGGNGARGKPGAAHHRPGGEAGGRARPSGQGPGAPSACSPTWLRPWSSSDAARPERLPHRITRPPHLLCCAASGAGSMSDPTQRSSSKTASTCFPLTASASAAWSLSFWSAYATAKALMAWSNVSLLPM